MRLSMSLIVAGLLGVVGGAWLIAPWAVGCAVVADSVALAAYGLLRDVPAKPESPEQARRRAA